MSDKSLKLKNAPIVEAVLDIDCDVPPELKFAKLESLARGRFREQYPKFRMQYLFEHQWEAKPDVEPKVSSRRDIQAFQFLQADEKQLVQVRVQGYSFNRLAPYASLDEYFPEIERTWRLYFELASPLQIRAIKLRYINRILLPTINGVVNLDDYFRVGPRLPDEDRLQFAGFLIQNMAVENKTGHQINSVLSMQPMEDDKLPIIFDNTAASTEGCDPNDWINIQSKIRELRELKNHIFRKTLTDKCLDLFQQ